MTEKSTFHEIIENAYNGNSCLQNWTIIKKQQQKKHIQNKKKKKIGKRNQRENDSDEPLLDDPWTRRVPIKTTIYDDTDVSI